MILSDTRKLQGVKQTKNRSTPKGNKFVFIEQFSFVFVRTSIVIPDECADTCEQLLANHIIDALYLSRLLIRHMIL